MTDEELNRAAAEAMGWRMIRRVRNSFAGPVDYMAWVDANGDEVMSPTRWSPATKIEHAWIVQQAACKRDARRFKDELDVLNPILPGCASDVEIWLATAPPRARTEAAVAVLTNTKGE